jgi:hypothetical protein
MSLRILAIFATWFVFAACPVVAQDPFGDADDGGNLADEPSTPAKRGETAPSQVDVKERDAVILSLRRQPPQHPLGVAKAIQWTARIRRWDEAGRWLDKLASMEIEPNVAVQIVDTLGSKILLDLEAQARGLSDTQRETLAKITQLATQSIHDPKTLSERVEQLRSSSKGERLAAYEALRTAGDSGITAILNSLLAENAQAPNASMCEAFSLLGEHTSRAWQSAMTTQHEDARERLVALVAPLPKPKMGCELMAELFDPAVSNSVRASLERSLTGPQPRLPTAVQVHQFAIELVEQSLNHYQRRARLNEIDLEIAWTLDSDGRTLREMPVIPAMLSLARASQAGQIAVRFVPQSDLASATAIAAHWEYLAVRGAVDATQDTTFQAKLPESLRDSPEFACLVWDAAVSHRLTGAQSVAIANLSRWEGAGIPGPVRERLVAATRSGLPMVRYPAANALMKTQLGWGENNSSTATFNGSSRVEAVANEMRQLTPEPVSILIGGNEGLRGHLHGLLDQFGYRVFEAASAAEVFQLLRTGLPVEAMFIVEHVRELDLGQLVQRTRANPTTATVPIALLADSLSRGEHSVAEEDHRVVVGSVPPTLDGLADIISRMQAVSDPPPLSLEARILFKASAQNYFESVRSIPALRTGPLSEARIEGTREEQNELIRIVANAIEPEMKREQASRNFVQSVRRFGLLITSETAQEQYDVYNQRGESEPVTRAVLGRVLDAIEATNGQRGWSEVRP